MTKPDLLLLTNIYPAAGSKGEDWVFDEIRITHNNYNNIYIVPDRFEKENRPIPGNCTVINLYEGKMPALSFSELMNCLYILLTDILEYPRILDYFKGFRYNFSLIRQLHRKAKCIAQHKECFRNNTIIYAYWADNLATTACIISQKYFKSRIVTRGHGFEIFEDQTKYGVVPFRKYQYQFISGLFADSRRGMEHLRKKHTGEKHNTINQYSYVGTEDRGITPLKEGDVFRIATCSFVREVKRLHLLPEILKHVSFPLEWHILGDGPELPRIRQLNEQLPQNVKVVYHGYLKNEDILGFYQNTPVNLLVSLSFSEGLPVTMMEALSFGIPILSTDVGGCSEICNENTGILIPKEFDPAEVALLMRDFKDSQRNSNTFRSACRNYWKENFNAVNNYLKFSETIISLK